MMNLVYYYKKNKKKKMLKKRSQITVFIILGIIISSVFFFLFYITYSSSSIKTAKQVEKTAYQLLETSSLKYYIQTCLDDSTSEALELIGKQGGFIYNYQEGSIISINISQLEYQGTNITSHIFKPLSSSVYDDYRYPCLKESQFCLSTGNLCCCTPSQSSCCAFIGDSCYKNYNHTWRFNSPNIGRNLDQKTSTSQRISLELCKANNSITSSYGCICNKFCNISIEKQLESYILNKTKKCINLSVFNEYNLSVGEIKTNVTIGLNDVHVILDFPLIIKLRNQQPIKKIVNFYSYQPIRLLQMYQLAYDLVAKDLGNISYDILIDGREEINKEPERYGYMDIIRKYPYVPATDSVVIINDTKGDSLLNGRPFVFQFGRENRIPAIDHISYYTINCDNSLKEMYDVCVNVNEEIKIMPIVYDPDEDEISITYHGWKSNRGFSYGLTYPPDTPSNIWEESDYYNNPAYCVYPNGKLMNKTCANYTTNAGDIGNNNKLVVLATDSSGNMDFQIVTVLVNNIPSPQIYYNLTSSPTACNLRIKNPGITEVIGGHAINGFGYGLTAGCNELPFPPPNDKYDFIWKFAPPLLPGPIPYFKQSGVGCNEGSFSTIFTTKTDVYVKVKDIGAENDSSSLEITVWNDNDGDKYCYNNIDNPAELLGGGRIDANSSFDCDDNNPNVYPKKQDEYCDGIDDNCDGVIDEGFDYDGCTQKCQAKKFPTNQPLVWTHNGGVHNCCGDDTGNPYFEPAAFSQYESNEVSCSDGIDNNCDGDIDSADADCP